MCVACCSCVSKSLLLQPSKPVPVFIKYCRCFSDDGLKSLIFRPLTLFMFYAKKVVFSHPISLFLLLILLESKDFSFVECTKYNIMALKVFVSCALQLATTASSEDPVVPATFRLVLWFVQTFITQFYVFSQIHTKGRIFGKTKAKVW